MITIYRFKHKQNKYIFNFINRFKKKFNFNQCLYQIILVNKYDINLKIKMSYLAKNYNRKKISFTRGKGSFLYSSNGSKYLDFCSGIAVNSLGHANPQLIKALNSQAKKVWHVSNAFIIPE